MMRLRAIGRVRVIGLVFGLFLSLLAGCVTEPSLASREAAANQLAAAHGWAMRRLPAGQFEIASWAPVNGVQDDDLWIYIEGDGLAYLSSDKVSDDPTPMDPMGLQLALAQPSGHAVYLARPCQYGLQPACRRGFWSDQRFSEEMVSAMDSAVSQVKLEAHAKRLTLIGYSGGGAIAALLAERRTDVNRLVTVAGNLSTRRWATLQRLSPLKGADPYAGRDRLAGIEQWHFVGGADNVVPKSLAFEFAAGQPKARVIEEAAFDHHCCWAAKWSSIWTQIDR